MADTLLSKVINEEINVDLFIKWLLDTTPQEQYSDEFNDCKCSQTEFLTYFLNFVHEEVPCQHQNGERDTPCKVKMARTNDRIHKGETMLFPNNDKADLKKPAAGSSCSLNRTYTDDSINISYSTNAPRLFKIEPEYTHNNGYASPISPLYRNQNCFVTTKCKRLNLPQDSLEKISPLCLGDFILNRKCLDKKKISRNVFSCDPMEELSKRIKPTSICTVNMNGGFRKAENSFNSFHNTKELSADSLNENRNFLAEERQKILSRKNSGDDLVAAPPHIASLVNLKVEVEPDVNCVSYKSQLNYLVEVYVCVLKNNLVLNITSELQFLISLLLNKQLSSRDSREDVRSNLEEDFGMDVDVLSEEDRNMLQSVVNRSKRKVCSSDLFETIHNVVYFAARCLESQIDVLRHYDKPTLKLLSQNKRLGSFAGAFSEKLRKIADKKTDVAQEHSESDRQTNICFNMDTDNRENFPSDSSAHGFRKQRDLFYEILRIWENSHMLPGWNFAVGLAGKIRSLFGLHNEPANFMHLSRLFKAQLLSTCGRSQKEEGLTENQMPFLSSLPDVDADKLNRLKNRLVTKQSANSISSLPSFTGPQEFYKDFIIVAANYTFNKHLSDTLITEIVELNDTKFSSTGWEESDGPADPATRKAYLVCLKSLRVLAKFLGFIEALPYKSDCVNYSEKILTAHLNVRRQTTPSFNIQQLLADSIKHSHIILTVPWITEYLSMMDYITLRLPYYVSVFRILFDLSRNCEIFIRAGWSDGSYKICLVRFCLGWLFELPHFPDSEYFNFRNNPVDITVKNVGRRKGTKTKSLDDLNIVDQNVLYICCPYLEEIKRLLSSNALKKNVTVKHITPVTAVQSSSEIAKKRIEQQLEESFFNGQPISVKKTVEFVSERVASSCVKYICSTIVPAGKSSALDQLRSYLATWKQKHDSVSPKKQKHHKATLRMAVNQMTQSNLANLQDACEKEVRNITKEKIPPSIDGLLAIDVLPQVKEVCVGMAIKMCVERVGQWMSSHVTISIFTKDFDGEVQKAINPEKKKAVKEKMPFALPPEGSAKQHNDNTTSAFHLLERTKELTIQVLENNTQVTEETVINVLNEANATFTERCDVNECIKYNTCALLFDLALLLTIHKPRIMAHPEVLEKFVQVWRCCSEKTKDLFKNLLCVRNIMAFSQSHDETTAWIHYAGFVAFLVKEQMLTCDEFESQCLGFFKKDWNENALRNFTLFLRTFIDKYKSDGGSVDKFVALLEFLSDFCVDL